MELGKITALAITAILVAPVFAVESIYLDAVPVTNPGEYLAPAELYLQVPPPAVSYSRTSSLAPATVYDYSAMNTRGTVGLTASSTNYAGYIPSADTDEETSGDKLRVLIKAGLDNASDVPLAVVREHFADLDDMELVADGEAYEVMVEIETMRLASSGTVFIVVNAYRDVDGESLIFYNNFGYLGDLKVLSGSASYATNLETALEKEAERLQE
jgi:hypothetical protein